MRFGGDDLRQLLHSDGCLASRWCPAITGPGQCAAFQRDSDAVRTEYVVAVMDPRRSGTSLTWPLRGHRGGRLDFGMSRGNCRNGCKGRQTWFCVQGLDDIPSNLPSRAGVPVGGANGWIDWSNRRRLTSVFGHSEADGFTDGVHASRPARRMRFLLG